MIRFLAASQTEALADWPSSIACMRAAYGEPVEAAAVPGRLIAGAGTSWIRCLPAIPARGRYMGTKQISRTREGKLVYLITLFDRTSGELAWMIDALAITALRTAATSIAAIDLLRPEGALDVAVLGSGLEARSHLEALAAARTIRSLRIYSPTEANRDRFVAEARARGHAATAAATPAAAAEGASLVIAAARSRGELPILHGAWLAASALAVSIGSTIPIQREIDISVVERASLIVADVIEEVVHDTGDMIAVKAAGIGFEDKLFSLADLAQGRIPAPRLADGGVHLFKSVGSALQDIALAELIAARAEERGVGRALDAALEVKTSIGKKG